MRPSRANPNRIPNSSHEIHVAQHHKVSILPRSQEHTWQASEFSAKAGILIEPTVLVPSSEAERATRRKKVRANDKDESQDPCRAPPARKRAKQEKGVGGGGQAGASKRPPVGKQRSKDVWPRSCLCTCPNTNEREA
jgi:hypothetical protein